MTEAPSKPLTLDMIRNITAKLKAAHLPLDVRLSAETDKPVDKFREYQAKIEAFLNKKPTP